MNPRPLGRGGGQRDEHGYMAAATLNIPSRDSWRDKTGRFIEAITKNLPSPIDPREIVYEQFIIDAIYESAGNGGKEVKLTLPDEIMGLLSK